MSEVACNLLGFACCVGGGILGMVAGEGIVKMIRCVLKE